MNHLLQPILEFTVILPGTLLAYLPVKPYLKQNPRRLAAWMVPLLILICLTAGTVCCSLQLRTAPVLFCLLPCLIFLYHKTLMISMWKSGNIALAICAVFACVNNLSKVINTLLVTSRDFLENSLYFEPCTGLIYNLICILFVAAAWYPATHSVRTMIEDKNLAQTWYIFWILPLISIALNCFIVPKYSRAFYNSNILHSYIAIILFLFIILILFYAMFFLMADSLNRNAHLQQENQLLSMQRARYDTLRTAIEETRQARHDMRHHFLQLSSMADQGNLNKIKEYLSNAVDRIPSFDFHFCENQAADSVIGYYCTLTRNEGIPFRAQIHLPAQLAIDEMDLCLILSNLLENAFEASLKTDKSKQQITIMVYPPFDHLLLIQVENAFNGSIHQKNGIFQSSKRKADGIGIQSVRRIAEKNGGTAVFSCEDHIFTAKIMLRTVPQ